MIWIRLLDQFDPGKFHGHLDYSYISNPPKYIKESFEFKEISACFCSAGQLCACCVVSKKLSNIA